MTSDDSRIFFAYFVHSPIWPVINIGEKVLEPSNVKFLSLVPYIFDVDLVAKIRFVLSITVLEKKKT